VLLRAFASRGLGTAAANHVDSTTVPASNNPKHIAPPLPCPPFIFISHISLCSFFPSPSPLHILKLLSVLRTPACNRRPKHACVPHCLLGALLPVRSLDARAPSSRSPPCLRRPCSQSHASSLERRIQYRRDDSPSPEHCGTTVSPTPGLPARQNVLTSYCTHPADSAKTRTAVLVRSTRCILHHHSLNSTRTASAPPRFSREFKTICGWEYRDPSFLFLFLQSVSFLDPFLSLPICVYPSFGLLN
jgi:hypothetical protein